MLCDADKERQILTLIGAPSVVLNLLVDSETFFLFQFGSSTAHIMDKLCFLEGAFHEERYRRGKARPG